MKTWYIVLIIALVAAVAPWAATQSSATVPKYDLATESTFSGTVLETSDRVCPVSGGMGFHLMLKLQNGEVLEVHVAASKMMKAYGMGLNKGDRVEVVGSLVRFEGKNAIFARQVIRDNETFTFRDPTGNPVW
jgi:hypothetical protein